jgi:hypothetical protein
MQLRPLAALVMVGLIGLTLNGCDNKRKSQSAYYNRTAPGGVLKNNTLMMQQMKYRQQQHRMESELMGRNAKVTMVAGFIKAMEEDKNQNIALMVSGFQSVTDSANQATAQLNGTTYHPVAAPKPTQAKGGASVVDANSFAEAYVKAKAAGAEITQTRSANGVETMVIRQNSHSTCIITTTEELAADALAPF